MDDLGILIALLHCEEQKEVEIYLTSKPDLSPTAIVAIERLDALTRQNVARTLQVDVDKLPAGGFLLRSLGCDSTKPQLYENISDLMDKLAGHAVYTIYATVAGSPWKQLVYSSVDMETDAS